MPEKMGNVLGSASVFRSVGGGITNKKRELKKVGFHWPQLKHCMNRSVLNVLCSPPKGHKKGVGERKKTLPGEW